jgi:hypothetical protein
LTSHLNWAVAYFCKRRWVFQQSLKAGYFTQIACRLRELEQAASP